MDANQSNPGPTRVLFVCLGNICRSPLAEGVFQHLVEEAGVSDEFEVDSAGTGSWHVGEHPDTRATAVAEAHGVTLTTDTMIAIAANRDEEKLLRAREADARKEIQAEPAQ